MLVIFHFYLKSFLPVARLALPWDERGTLVGGLELAWQSSFPGLHTENLSLPNRKNLKKKLGKILIFASKILLLILFRYLFESFIKTCTNYKKLSLIIEKLFSFWLVYDGSGMDTERRWKFTFWDIGLRWHRSGPWGIFWTRQRLVRGSPRRGSLEKKIFRRKNH